MNTSNTIFPSEESNNKKLERNAGLEVPFTNKQGKPSSGEKDCYIDRFGSTHIWHGKPINREGVFAFIYDSINDAILLTWPPFAPLVADCPGGGIKIGESLEQALHREIVEETGLEFEVEYDLIFRQNVLFYADDKDQFWDYKQTFVAINANGRSNGKQKWKTPECGMAGWVNLDFSNSNFGTNAVHWHAINQLMKAIISRNVDQRGERSK